MSMFMFLFIYLFLPPDCEQCDVDARRQAEAIHVLHVCGGGVYGGRVHPELPVHRHSHTARLWVVLFFSHTD